MGLPYIIVQFKQLASTAVLRSQRGILAIVIQDATAGVSWTSKSYNAVSELTASEFTSENLAAIQRAFLAAPYKVIVVRVGSSDDMEDAGSILDNLTYNWLCAVPSGFQAGVVTYVQAKNTASRVRKIKAIVSGQNASASPTNDIHIVNVANTGVTLKGAVSSILINLYLPRLAGILAACPITKSVTYYELTDLQGVSSIANLDTSINAGNLCLFQDDDTFRIARGVNTLTTTTADLTEDMKKITIVEAMDMIMEDIIKTFKANWQGQVKNNADNQALLVSDVLGYFRELEAETVLDSVSTVEIDVPAMRAAWTAAGTDVSDLTDAQVKAKTFRSNVYLAASCRILDALEDFQLTVTLG